MGGNDRRINKGLQLVGAIILLMAGWELSSTYPKVMFQVDAQAAQCSKRLNTVCQSAHLQGRELFWLGVVFLFVGLVGTGRTSFLLFKLLSQGDSKQEDYNLPPQGDRHEVETQSDRYEVEPQSEAPAQQDPFLSANADGDSPYSSAKEEEEALLSTQRSNYKAEEKSQPKK